MAVNQPVRPAVSELLGGGGDVVVAHQAFADEEGLTPAAAMRWMSPWVKMPLSQIVMRSAGTRGARRSVVSSVTSKVRRLRLLMPIRRQSKFERAIEFGVVVDFDDGIHAEVFGGGCEVARGLIVDLRHDDQDAVGAPERALRRPDRCRA